jgi:hypothetical protein
VDFLDSQAGLVHVMMPSGRANVRVVYTAGFDPIPEDIQQACVLLVAEWYAAAKLDAGKRWQEDPTGVAYGRFAPDGLTSPVRALLAPYRDVMK